MAQPNEITLSVDYLNDGVTFTPEVYEQLDDSQPNRTVYSGENHANDARDLMTLYRSFPTKNGNFKGVQKSSIKMTKDHQVAGVDASTEITGTSIIDISMSLPVGLTVAEELVLRQRAAAALVHDFVVDLAHKGMI